MKKKTAKTFKQNLTLPRFLSNRANEIKRFLERKPQVKHVALKETSTGELAYEVDATKPIIWADCLADFQATEPQPYRKTKLFYIDDCYD